MTLRGCFEAGSERRRTHLRVVSFSRNDISVRSIFYKIKEIEFLPMILADVFERQGDDDVDAASLAMGMESGGSSDVTTDAIRVCGSTFMAVRIICVVVMLIGEINAGRCSQIYGKQV